MANGLISEIPISTRPCFQSLGYGDYFWPGGIFIYRNDPSVGAHPGEIVISVANERMSGSHVVILRLCDEDARRLAKDILEATGPQGATSKPTGKYDKRREKYGLPSMPIGMPQVDPDLMQAVGRLVMGRELTDAELEECMDCADCDAYANSDDLPGAIQEWLGAIISADEDEAGGKAD